MLISSFTIYIEVFSPGDVLFHSVSGQLAGADVSSSGSCCSWISDVPTLHDISIKRGVGVKTEPNLIPLSESTFGATVSGDQRLMGEDSAEGYLMGGDIHVGVGVQAGVLMGGVSLVGAGGQNGDLMGGQSHAGAGVQELGESLTVEGEVSVGRSLL